MTHTTLRHLNPSDAGRSAIIDGQTGTLSWARNPTYPRIPVWHWWLIVPTVRFPDGAAMSLQWVYPSTPVVLLDEGQVAA